jgi:DNA-binding response OmpR family regulator
MRALLRRVRGQAGPALQVIEVGALSLDPASREASVEGRAMELTSYEFDLLLALAASAGRVLSREQLLDRIKGGAEEAFDRSIDVHISKLRQKLGDDARSPRFLKTVRGVGYLLSAPETL